ncbi:ABC transporter permease subunit [Clostridium acetobutylicum]|uniref:Glutamine-binding periplasmic protein fused to glutamine permease n=2 Tax=Clostridiaceae TaxID=31979 RepID=Q97MT0_CLOAB|nr:Glutamine-binding periplasmic protein fused to glutamine permease [Clostridium acetobutylicum ATCC 824]AEI33485.1 glutamine-binding periplasmic protein fused to glutamine permease [Clostridium acetobutylicum DSM 1731]AWV82263.1 ABC transporter permease subunit [Clostridium acetobutylicum]PSM05247.1 glutamine ABC transporter permease [Clostridium sp. NJ4]MBC2395389.1 ABC transporter permease subunit [Clostridium acetobutylicum]
MMCFAILLTGCENSNSNSDKSKTSSKKYTIATDATYAPFEFRTGSDYQGIDIDILSAIAKKENFTYDLKPMNFNGIIPALQSNQVDGSVSGMSINDERKKTLDFSNSYYDSGLCVVAKSDNKSVKTINDIKGKTAALKKGTAGAAYAEANKEKYGLTLKYFDDSPSMFQAVMNGNADITLEDYPVIAYKISIDKNSGLKIVGDEKITTSPYGFAVKKGTNKELLKKFNDGLKKIKADGEYDKIISKYIKTGKDSKNAKAFKPEQDNLVKQYAPQLLKGLGMTLFITVIAMIIALFIGAIFGFFSISTSKVLNTLARWFVDIIRGTPLLVQAFFIFFGIPGLSGLKINPVVAGIIAVSLNAGAYMSEIFRGGILSINQGQMEAARSLGIPYRTAMLKIVFPQAVKVMIPSIVNQFIISLKDTSILSVIGIQELTNTGQIIIGATFKAFQIWLIVAIMYFIVIKLLSILSRKIERYVKI